MARTIAQIQADMIAQIQATPELAAANSPSKRALWRLWTYIVATAQATEEQLNDAFIAQVESIAATTPPGTPAWLQNKIFQFQYNEDDPQIVQLNPTTFAPEYPVINTDDQIISRCSVVSGALNTVNIKVATGNPPAALSTDQLSALSSYVNYIGFTGLNYTVTSNPADQIYIQADIYYMGQYAAVILNNLTTAIQTYLAAIPFNGILKLSDLEIAIRNVAGVNDIVFKNVAAHADATTISGATYLVQNNTLLLPSWQTQAGYIIPETTTGYTIAPALNVSSGSLNLIPQ